MCVCEHARLKDATIPCMQMHVSLKWIHYQTGKPGTAHVMCLLAMNAKAMPQWEHTHIHTYADA